MRTDPSIRNTTVLARGNRLFKQFHDDDLRAPFYLCCILNDNALAQRVFTSGRAGLPAAKDMGTLYTATIPLLKRRQRGVKDGIRIVSGGRVGAEAIVDCLNRCGKSKQFYPVYTLDDLLADDGILRGLHLDEFHVAIVGDRVVGVTACWNQLAFRRMVVAGYCGSMRLLKPALSPVARMLGLAPLPNPGDAVRSVLAACIAVEDNDPRVFKALLHSILHDQHRSGKTFLMVGLMEQDPLLQVARQYLHLPTRSGVYALQWDGVDQATQALDGRVPYLELGSL